MCRALVDHAFEEFGLNRVSIACATENKRSCAIPERLSFQREGIQRQAEWLYDHFVDHVVYATLASEWQKRRSELPELRRIRLPRGWVNRLSWEPLARYRGT